MSVYITLTTIHEPRVIENVLENARMYGHRDLTIVVVGDRKTPASVESCCAAAGRRFDQPVRYLDVPAQQDYLKRFPALDRYLPYDSFARRNVGDLLAWEEGASVVIRIDDDNYPTEGDFVGRHRLVAEPESWLNVVETPSGWFNVCETLADAQGIPFYPRGFPYSQRWKPVASVVTARRVKVALNAGLWIGDPDVDAITRLCKPVDVTEFRAGLLGSQFALASGTWCPINTQNTAYAARLLPAAFVPPRVGRYDDIWGGYLLRKLMDHMGDHVTYGLPILRQLRNVHNLWKDLDMELNGNQFTDHLIDAMDQVKLTASSYLGLYVELADGLDRTLTENRAVFQGVIEGMRIWAESVGKVGRNDV